MLVPAQWQGSVEHFYHFMLGYFVPVVLWQHKSGQSDFAVRDCGPMNPWFNLLQADTKIEFLAPGVMLQRTLTHRQEQQVFWDWDNPTRFHSKSLSAVSEIIRSRASNLPAHSDDSTKRITILVRGKGPDFYHAEKTEVYGSGSELRSIPNLSDLAIALESFGTVKFIDAATLSPAEQVQEFMHTDILIAQHGAGLSNILWMPSGATVIEIQPPLAPTIDHIFSNLAAALKLKYSVLHQEHEHSSIDVNVVSHCVKGVLAGEIGVVPLPSTRFPLRWARNLFRQW